MVRRWGFLAILNQLSDLSLQFTDYWWVHLIFVNLSYLTAAEVITSRALGFMLQPNLRSCNSKGIGGDSANLRISGLNTS
jgi:TRAP-type C4-dicarboxylate transport system permease large subunit